MSIVSEKSQSVMIDQGDPLLHSLNREKMHQELQDSNSRPAGWVKSVTDEELEALQSEYARDRKQDLFDKASTKAAFNAGKYLRVLAEHILF